MPDATIQTRGKVLETRGAVLTSNPPPHFRIVTIPKGQPQTKPRACNVGLFFATGDFLVIYDAEDTPDPDQLKPLAGARLFTAITRLKARLGQIGPQRPGKSDVYEDLP